MTATSYPPYCESLRTTLLRTITIALIVGLILAVSWHNLARWPFAILIALWPSLGGHFVELFFLNVLRPRLANARMSQITARLAVWFIGGSLFALAMAMTAFAILGSPASWRVWWIGGLAFIGIELIVHGAMQLRGKPNFYNGRG